MPDNWIQLCPPSTEGRELQNVVNAVGMCSIAPPEMYISKFEGAVCNLLSMKSAVAVSSASAAVHLSLIALGVGPRDIVICPDLSDPSSYYPILYQHATPVFVDCETDAFGMCDQALEMALRHCEKNERLPKAVIISDLYGHSADYEHLLPLCDKYGVPVIENAAGALGTKYHHRSCGTFGMLNVLSFSADQIVSSSEGSMIFSSDDHLIDKIRSMIFRRSDLFYKHGDTPFVYEYGMSGLCAAMGLGQLDSLHDRIIRKKAIYDRYKSSFLDIPINMYPTDSQCEPNYWMSVARVDECSNVSAEQMIASLTNVSIHSNYVWKPFHLQEISKQSTLFSTSGKSPNSEMLYRSCICLPSGLDMKTAEQLKVASAVVDMACLETQYSTAG